jgi:hypothetical protein
MRSWIGMLHIVASRIMFVGSIASRKPSAEGTGRCIQLDELIPRGEVFMVSEIERANAAVEFWPLVAKLLGIISEITRGEWHHLVSSKEAVGWRIG